MRIVTILAMAGMLMYTLKGEGKNNPYYFEKISAETGFAFDAVYSILEDKNGFVWFGCNNGLYFYNTSEIKKIDLLPNKKYNSQSLRIKHIYQDSYSTIWVCSEDGLFKRDNNSGAFTKILMHTKNLNFNTKNNISKILQYDNDLYFILMQGMPFYFDINEQILYPIKFNGFDLNAEFSYLGQDSKENIFLGHATGKLFIGNQPDKMFNLLYDSGSHQIKTVCDDNNKYYVGFEGKGVEVINAIGDKIFEYNNSLQGEFHLPDNRVRDIIKTEDGKIWIGTYLGILIIDNESKTILTNDNTKGLPHNSIYVLHKGRNNGIWIGTWAGGLAYYHEMNFQFNHIRKIPEEKEVKSVISAFTETHNGEIWIGSEQAGLTVFNPVTGEFKPTPKEIAYQDLKRIKSLSRIDENNVVIGSFYQGLWLYNLKNETLSKLSNKDLRDESIISTVTGNENSIWIGPRGAGHSIFQYDRKNNTYNYYDLAAEFEPNTWSLRVWDLLIDSSHKIWACSDEGIFCKDIHQADFQKYFRNDTLYGLDRTLIYTVLEDNDENIWIGTKGKGIFRFSPAKNLLEPISIKASENIDVVAIIEDRMDNLWFSSDDGVFFYSKEQKQLSQYSKYDGLPGNHFTPNSALATKSGDVFFGSSNGFSYINPNNIVPNSIEPDIYLSNFTINNVPFSQTDGYKANANVLEEIKEISLKSKQNSLSFSVVSNNFIKKHNNKFKYRLVNYEDNWIDLDVNKDITFTKIPSGKYTLEVIGANNNNIWSNTPLSIDIAIAYPFWQKWYALVIYIFIIQTIAYLIVKESSLRMKLRKEIMAERYKGEAQEQLYGEKMKFFTNVSHEIRTPLTLIISPLNNLLKKFKYDENTSEQLLTIKRNASRLLRLTNQILDFRLLEVDKLKAHHKKADVIPICNEVINCLEPLIKEKQINFIFNSDFKELNLQVDPDMLEKIVYNLVLNAIKFSEEKSQIFLSVESKNRVETDYRNIQFAGEKFIGESMEIKVRDFGKGIKKDLMPRILDRFSTDPSETETGTGIGLHLCQEYARLHGGNIMVESEEGKGATFTLNVPFQTNSEYKKKSFVKQLAYENSTPIELSEAEISRAEKNKKVILLAEDNNELRNYLKSYLSNYFKVITAKNGHQAYEIAAEVLPDIIITDILMPQTDGIELTQKLKNNHRTNPIPIIVLTALSESKYQKESLLKGVESYLTKPVDETLLLAQIENILNKQAMMKKHFSSGDAERMENADNHPGTIIEKAEKVIEQNLQNAEFGMIQLLEALNVSRSTFHRKIKNATNQSPSEFIRDIRLKCAIKIMKSGKYNIDEVGSYVGFNSTSYFIRSFKNKYGQTPKEYYKKLK